MSRRLTHRVPGLLKHNFHYANSLRWHNLLRYSLYTSVILCTTQGANAELSETGKREPKAFFTARKLCRWMPVKKAATFPGPLERRVSGDFLWLQLFGLRH
jgi:hypothetical protein